LSFAAHALGALQLMSSSGSKMDEAVSYLHPG
jgi:hypothetical protein